MAKERHDEQATSSKATMAVMAIGGLAVVALVVWALTRTVQPAPEPAAVATSTFPVTTESAPPLQSDPGRFNTTAAPATTGAQGTATLAPQVHPPGAEDTAAVARIGPSDLRSKFDAKQVTVIDVRDATSFMGNHIPGALNVPVQQMESQVTFLPKNKPIVTYCT